MIILNAKDLLFRLSQLEKNANNSKGEKKKQSKKN